MRTLISLIIAFIMIATLACNDEQTTEYTQSNDEKILTIKHQIIKDGPGYDNTELIIDTTTVRYIAHAKGIYLPGIDTTFNITENEWNIIINSFNMDPVMTLDSTYIEEFYVGDALIILEIITDQRTKEIRFDKSRNISQIDSLNIILNRIRESL